MSVKSKEWESCAMREEYLPNLIFWSCILETCKRSWQNLVRHWEESKNRDGGTKSRQDMRKSRFGRKDYQFIFRQECWVLFSCKKWTKLKNSDILEATSRDGGFNRDTYMCSELSKKTISAATYSGLLENQKTAGNQSDSSYSGLLWKKETIVLYLASGPCSRLLLFLLFSTSGFPLLPLFLWL